jgi:hypothetical protein
MRPKVRAVLSSASNPPGFAKMNVACDPTPGAAEALEPGDVALG